MIKPWLFVGAGEALIGVAAAQTEILPESMLGIFLQLPLVAVVIWLQLQNQKWYTQMMTAERQSSKDIYESQLKALKEIYEGQQAFLSALLAQIDSKQNKMADRVELLTQQVAMFTATLAEVTKVDDVIDRLLEKIQK